MAKREKISWVNRQIRKLEPTEVMRPPVDVESEMVERTQFPARFPFVSRPGQPTRGTAAMREDLAKVRQNRDALGGLYQDTLKRHEIQYTGVIEGEIAPGGRKPHQPRPDAVVFVKRGIKNN